MTLCFNYMLNSIAIALCKSNAELTTLQHLKFVRYAHHTIVKIIS